MTGYHDVKPSSLSSFERSDFCKENFKEKEEFTKILSQVEILSKASEGESLLEVEEETINEDEDEDEGGRPAIEGIVGRDCLNFLLMNPHRNQYVEIKKNAFIVELESIRSSWSRDYSWHNGFYPLSLLKAKLDTEKICSSKPFESKLIGYSESECFILWKNNHLNLDGTNRVENTTDVLRQISHGTKKYYQVENYILSELVLDGCLKSGLKLDGEYFKDGSNLVKYRVFFKRKYYFFTFDSGRLIDYLEESHDSS
ncbi:hypothetical protein M634_24685 [Vibrio parahaemolyticus O1:Kuk str. FDA_R31]|uniref:hypothetical protein n=1 Tax=Vibrio parahaemolyticus TaxID=670 RepID=UPI0003590931|nr:hypothetical protein [Vibrio parahaemolyticus]AGQ94167.1 hypothetical protein M634_24685 [Vibrio parahaemolyticus O1:Kuk str. FDA_R31]EHH2506644.1 hypothetical protein [Vibrio parahaemolyticus]EIZ1328736.1 hypothetical protein [Vibrio parahaemolyticus]EJB0396646.1 hypothetical protein [Vibrio parahaemolyticus]EJB5623647.1 hypothetical protein [Vibrio parahaemolyticus]